MDYNPYNRNIISHDDILQKKKEKLNVTNSLILGNSMRNSFTKNNNNNNLYNPNNKNIVENRKDNNLLIQPSNIIFNNNNNIHSQIPNIIHNQNNFPYLIYIPLSPSYSQYNPSLTFNPNNINPFNSQQIPTQINSQLNQLNEIDINNNINDYSLFGLESKRKEEERLTKKEEYRKELLKQIEEKKKADEARKKKIKEEEKNELKRNEEYFKLKKKQEDEQNKKLRERIARRMQRQQMDEFANSSHILEISKDFENMNKSRQGTSLVNNIESNHINKLETGYRENIVNLEDNYQDDNFYDYIDNNMISEEENYLKEIDNEYNELCQSIKLDIDEMINKNKTDAYLEIPYYHDKRAKKEKQYANYILGKSISPPTPIKLNDNTLSHSYNNRNPEKSKKINLDDFFNQDIKKDKYSDKKYNIKPKDVKININKEYFAIFENLQEIQLYTKKYSSNKNFDSNSESFMSNQTHFSDSSLNKNNYETKNKFGLQSYYNSTISNSMYEKEQNKNENEKDEENALKVEDSSMRTTENKNKSKTLLDKKLINIKENKEDEEDEEDDEENKKTKEEKTNNENKDNNKNLEDNDYKEGNNNNEEEKEEKEEEEKEEKEQEEKEVEKEEKEEEIEEKEQDKGETKEEKEEGEEEEEDDENNEDNEHKKE